MKSPFALEKRALSRLHSSSISFCRCTDFPLSCHVCAFMRLGLHLHSIGVRSTPLLYHFSVLCIARPLFFPLNKDEIHNDGVMIVHRKRMREGEIPVCRVAFIVSCSLQNTFLPCRFSWHLFVPFNKCIIYV
jgi:hypothetical protein